MEKYNYDIATKTMVCRDCEETLYEVPRSNLHKYRCWHCNGRGAEVDLLRYLHAKFSNNPEVRGYVTRNAQYPKQDGNKVRTADAKVVVNGREWLIEVDEKSHRWGRNHHVHRYKDHLVIENGLRLIRVFAGDSIAAVCEEIYRITTGELFDDFEDDNFVDVLGEDFQWPYAIRSRPEADAFFSKLYGEERNILRFYEDLFNRAWEEEGDEMLQELDLEHEPVAEPVTEPVTEQDVTTTTLKDEFVARFEELANYFLDVEKREESEQRSDMIGQLADLLLLAQQIAIMCDNVEEDDSELVSVIKRWLYAATSTLLFNGRAVSTTGNQRIQENEEKVEENITVEAQRQSARRERPQIVEDE